MKTTVDFKKISLFKTPQDSPGFLLWRVSTLWRSAIENSLKQVDLTHPQFVVLAVIGWLTREEDVISQIDVSRTTGLDQNTVSQIIRGLERKNLVARRRSIDERSKNPVLTMEGKEIISKALLMVEQADESFFSVVHKKELGILTETFRKLSLFKSKKL